MNLLNARLVEVGAQLNLGGLVCLWRLEERLNVEVVNVLPKFASSVCQPVDSEECVVAILAEHEVRRRVAFWTFDATFSFANLQHNG